jgi:hypothetical protein
MAVEGQRGDRVGKLSSDVLKRSWKIFTDVTLIQRVARIRDRLDCREQILCFQISEPVRMHELAKVAITRMIPTPSAILMKEICLSFSGDLSLPTIGQNGAERDLRQFQADAIDMNKS